MYSLANVLVDPYQEGVESALGSFVYFGNSPQEVLKRANEGLCYAEFTDFDEGGFFVEGPNSGIYQCIILRHGKGCRKFKGMQEFLEYAYKNAKYDTSNEYLHSVGIWVKDCEGNMFQVNVIEGTGIGFKGCFYYWDDILADYTFLNGERCGVYE